MHCLMYGVGESEWAGLWRGKDEGTREASWHGSLIKPKKIMGILSPICLLCPCLHSYQQNRASDIKTDEWQRRHCAPISSHIRSLNQKKMASCVKQSGSFHQWLHLLLLFLGWVVSICQLECVIFIYFNMFVFLLLLFPVPAHKWSGVYLVLS